jgi:CheY-like chemotaxis protein
LEGIQGGRVLLVEDNEINQQIAFEMLTDAGLVVEIADNGLIAMQKVTQTRFDVVLMDMQMPVMGGLDASRAIRAMPGFDALPIIAMTANAMQADRDSCAEAGMNDFVTKPFEPVILMATLARWIQPRTDGAHDLAAPDAPIASNAGTDVSETTAPERDLPIDIVGLDSALGLRRMLGKPTLYRRMLHQFAQGQRHAFAQLRAALQAGDAQTAERIAHTVKGLAGNIGATALQALAGQVEQDIHNGAWKTTPPPAWSPFEQALDALTSALLQRMPLDPPERLHGPTSTGFTAQHM